VEHVRLSVEAKERSEGVSERLDVERQLVAPEWGGRTGGDVVDAETWLNNNAVTTLGSVSSGVDVDLVTESGQSTRQFTDVDIHPTAIARAGLREG